MGWKSVAAVVLSLNLVLFSMVCAALEPAPVRGGAPLFNNNKCPPLLTVCLSRPFLEEQNCCPLIEGLVDLDAAACVCAAVKINLHGQPTVDLDILVNGILSTCGRKTKEYICS
ncbi:hypothetical protein Fmac_009352 [Flemingia macrophylla]|uniref:Bifunctional inhibitor/plant lipid transfer protein/seed storage helical domain-containing protein n=1 Tax=Flemingia macrophylla TaxID=520843 RepID=A0ABD1N004_9FABA